MAELRGVTKRFGPSVAVADVSLAIRGGELFTVLGPSGCGKTTMLRMLAGFESPTEGTVWLDGRDVTAEPPFRRDVNTVFQSYALFPHLTVADNVAFGLKVRNVPRAERDARVREHLDLLSLRGLEARLPATLSGGQRQRVALARALVCRPRVLLLDEPLSALDARLRRAMQAELKRLQQRVGITFVLVTHDQAEALAMSDRIAVMREGRLEQVGEAAEVYLRPRTRFIAAFLGDANVMDAVVLRSEDSTVRIRLGELALELDLPRQAWPASAPGPTVGAEVAVAFRPERVRLVDACSVRARVAEVVFHGATDDVVLEAEGGAHIRATVPARTAAVGDTVGVDVRSEDVVVLES